MVGVRIREHRRQGRHAPNVLEVEHRTQSLTPREEVGEGDPARRTEVRTHHPATRALTSIENPRCRETLATNERHTSLFNVRNLSCTLRALKTPKNANSRTQFRTFYARRFLSLLSLATALVATIQHLASTVNLY